MKNKSEISRNKNILDLKKLLRKLFKKEKKKKPSKVE